MKCYSSLSDPLSEMAFSLCKPNGSACNYSSAGAQQEKGKRFRSLQSLLSRLETYFLRLWNSGASFQCSLAAVAWNPVYLEARTHPPSTPEVNLGLRRSLWNCPECSRKYIGFVTVTTIFWAKVLCNMAAEDACFRMRSTLGVVLIRSPVFHICVPEGSRNGFGMRPYLLVQEKFV